MERRRGGRGGWDWAGEVVLEQRAGDRIPPPSGSPGRYAAHGPGAQSGARGLPTRYSEYHVYT